MKSLQGDRPTAIKGYCGSLGKIRSKKFYVTPLLSLQNPHFYPTSALPTPYTPRILHFDPPTSNRLNGNFGNIAGASSRLPLMSERESDHGGDEYRQQRLFKKQLLHLYTSQKDYDVVLKSPKSDLMFTAHSSILAVRCRALSSPLRAFLSNGSCPDKFSSGNCTKYNVRLPPASSFAIDQALRFVYSGSINFPPANHNQTPSLLNDILALASALDVPSLRNVCFRFVSERVCFRGVLELLDLVLSQSTSEQDVNRLTEIVCMKSADCDKPHNDECCGGISNAYLGLSEKLWRHVLQTEPLQMSEDQLWSLLVHRACGQTNISISPVSEMSTAERSRISKYMHRYCKPENLRILSFSAPFFVREVEPMRVFPTSEVLLKYRFDATVGLEPFMYSFPSDRLSFLSRVRQSARTIESGAHPHARGVRDERHVCMAPWSSQIAIEIDRRTALGKYAQLELFASAAKKDRFFFLRGAGPAIVSVCQSQQAGHHVNVHLGSNGDSHTAEKVHHVDSGAPIVLNSNAFHLSFYAPLNVGDAKWGFKLTVTNLR